MNPVEALDWHSLMFRGIFAMIFGVIAMIWPFPSFIAVVIAWGIYALVDGVISFVQGLGAGIDGAQRTFLIFFGAISVIAGLIAIFRPGISGTALIWALGFILVFRGIMEIIAAFSGAGNAKWLVFAAGVLWIIAGLIIMLAPGASTVGFALVLGIFAFIWGIFLFAAALEARSMEQRLTERRGGERHVEGARS